MHVPTNTAYSGLGATLNFSIHLWLIEDEGENATLHIQRETLYSLQLLHELWKREFIVDQRSCETTRKMNAETDKTKQAIKQTKTV